ncbi:ArsR/SmtB family transcription factor [Humibacter albus]|uniref:ArsR/SmtB family transcription factor n=1 Tax=Humibacter albus TaxID=427754 RepID=UPI0003B72E90|nr:ArsR family transcriptional regulator [Humibacter albus]
MPERDPHDDCTPLGVEHYPVPPMSEVQLVELLRAVADPIRLEIVRTLSDGEPRPKSELVSDFSVQKSTLSHHFKTLRESGLTQWTVVGRTHMIRLRRSELDERFPGLIDALVVEAA